MNELQNAKNKALADIDYFIHEIEENGLDKKIVAKLEKGKLLVMKSATVQGVNYHLAILINIFQKAFE